jgi:hypothetical protein
MTDERNDEKSILDKAKDLATDVKDKVTDLVGDNEEKITGAIDKAGEFVDDKTKHKYTDKIDRAQEAAKSAVSKVAGSTSDADTPADAPEAEKPASGESAEAEGKADPTEPVPDA